MKPNDWHIRNVDENTKRIVRVYAAEHRLSLAEALRRLVLMGNDEVEFDRLAPLVSERATDARRKKQ